MRSSGVGGRLAHVPPRKVRISVRSEHDGLRLDQILAAEVADLSRRKARTLLEIGGVFLDGKRVKVASRVPRCGQVIDLTLGSALRDATTTLGRDARRRDDARLPSLQVVHEDDEVIVVDKPAGLHTVPTPESDRGNLLDQLQRRDGAVEALHVVHRLDLATSGLLVFARDAASGRALEGSLASRAMSREYFAVLAGSVDDVSWTVATPVGGKRALSRFGRVERLGRGATSVHVHLDTGRTHQIRIHAHSIGHPVLGDRRYGPEALPRAPRLALHAARLTFPHPRTGVRLTFESRVPERLRVWLDSLRRGGSEPA